MSFPGDEHLFVMGRQDDLLDEIERFVTSVRDDEADLDRVLATLMFTDMASSTAGASTESSIHKLLLDVTRLTDARWANL